MSAHAGTSNLDDSPQSDVDIHGLLKRCFGYDSFRPLQEEIIRDCLAGRDVFALLPTGGGKSLCYQLPAIAGTGLTVVVSPLIALMKDQVDALQELGVAATFLNSSLDGDEARARFRGLHQNQYRLLYVSPERLAMPEFIETLKRWKVTRFAIDEAHCISEWGHDFRPEYRQLEALRAHFPGVPFMALTATATTRVRTDIVRHLKLDNPALYVASFNRPNLIYRVWTKEKPYEQLLAFAKKRKGESGIVYCLSRRGADENAARLKEDGISAIAYHAGMDSADRARAQDLFLRDTVKVVCATIAFGMGINKSNVRYVVHYDLPKNVEGYYQETGRAGRDGLPSECLLLFSAGDAAKLSRFIDDMSTVQEQQIARAQLNRMLHYSETSGCRRADLLKYFGEEYPDPDCASCDNCLAPRATYDGTLDAQKFLSCIYRIKERGFGTGMKHLIEVLRGANTENIRNWNHDQLSTYGIGKDKPAEDWQRIGRELLRLGFCAQAAGKYPTLELTQNGRQALSKREKIMLTKAPLTEKAAKHTGEIVCDEDLFEQLRGLRRQLADARFVPAFVIFSDAALRQMAQRYPETEDDFARISGVGEKKLKEFGDAFIREIHDFLLTHPKQQFFEGVSAPLERAVEQRDTVSASSALNGTAAQTLRMFKSGKSVADIAKERELSRSTIYQHLQSAVDLGEALAVERLAAPAELDVILAAFKTHGLSNLTTVYDVLDKKCEYGQLRLIRLTQPGGRDAALEGKEIQAQVKQELKSVFTHAYEPWSDADDKQLLQLYARKKSIEEISATLGRQSNAIETRYVKLTDPGRESAFAEERRAQRAAALRSQSWTDDDVILLRALVKAGKKIEQLAVILQRDAANIQAKLAEL